MFLVFLFGLTTDILLVLTSTLVLILLQRLESLPFLLVLRSLAGERLDGVDVLIEANLLPFLLSVSFFSSPEVGLLVLHSRMVVLISCFTTLIMLLRTSTMFFQEVRFLLSSLVFITGGKRDLVSQSPLLLDKSTSGQDFLVSTLPSFLDTFLGLPEDLAVFPTIRSRTKVGINLLLLVLGSLSFLLSFSSFLSGPLPTLHVPLLLQLRI